jgi:tetrahydromethanopterin S-methyltransferase subunit G
VQAVDSSQPSTQRRRSERISQSLPLVVRGIDLLGQPFEERTSTLALNFHGCRYSSKHHLPKNTWVTLELPQEAERRNVRARVAWIQRPHSVREFFQIAVELESPANIWGIESPPADWQMAETPVRLPAGAPAERELPVDQGPEAGTLRSTIATFMESVAPHMTNAPGDSAFAPASPLAPESAPVAENPLLGEWRAELERQASRAAETAAAQGGERIRQAIADLEKTLADAREMFSSQLTAKRDEFLGGLKSEVDEGMSQARELLYELDRKARELRAESEAAVESASRMAQARLQIEAAEAARAQQQQAGPSQETIAAESATASWRERLESEMAVAQAQWNELLQSSLDSSIERLVEHMSRRSQEVVRSAEQKMSERFSELREPLGQMSAEARETLSGLKSALEQEIARARSSLTEIEHSASRMKEYSAQLEAASHDSLNELHRRLENILEAQTDEMQRRVENLAAGVNQRLGPTLDSLGQQFGERTIADVESKIAPRIERVTELLRDLAAREVQAEESLRLHRERLRQVSENSQRETAAQMASTLASLRDDFESARKEALSKWSEELDAAGVRASHAAAESIGRSSEWFQQEARARLQVLVEQMLATAAGGFEEKTAEAARRFEARLEEQSTARVAQIHQQLDGVASELAGRARTEIGSAAEAAAASFGQVLHGISEREVEQFANKSRSAMAEREQDFEHFTHDAMRNLEMSAGTSLDRFRAQMASQLETSVAEGRGALAAEFASALDGYRAEREAHQKEWAASLGRLSDEAAGKYQERLQTTCDSWMVSSVRRLNEHGQNVIESLMRSADQSLRDSCSKVFEGLAAMLRDRTNAGGVVGFVPPPSRDAGESPVPHQQSASSSSNG